MPHVPLSTARYRSPHVSGNHRGTEGEGSEPRITRTQGPPNHSQDDHQAEHQPDDGVIRKERAVIADRQSDEGRETETRREEPVEQAGRKIPDQDAVHKALPNERAGKQRSAINRRHATCRTVAPLVHFYLYSRLIPTLPMSLCAHTRMTDPA